MVTRTPAYRSIEWALRLSWVSLVIVVVGFFTCYSWTLHGSALIVFNLSRASQPGDNATDEEREATVTDDYPTRVIAHKTADSFVTQMVFGVGIPVTGLLIANIVILSRARWQMIRGR